MGTIPPLDELSSRYDHGFQIGSILEKCVDYKFIRESHKFSLNDIAISMPTMKLSLLSRLMNLLEFFTNRIKTKPKLKTDRGLMGMYFVESNAKRNKTNRERQ